MRRKVIGVGALALLGVCAWSGAAQACEPPFTAWFVEDTFPVDGDEAAPINGVVAINLDFISDASSSPDLPDEATFERTFGGQVLRGGAEEVPGQWMYEPGFRRALFVADRDFAEGVRYEVRLLLRNSLFPDANFEDMTYTFSFTTGATLDTSAPAFSGVQTLVLTEAAHAEQECCEPEPDLCIGACPPCLWCWTVGWRYAPRAELTFPTVQDEFGRGTVSYVVYRPATADAPLGEPVGVVRDAANTELRLAFEFEEDAEGPFCFAVRAMDIWGRWDNNNVVRCVTRAELTPIERREIPEPDRSGCVDEGGDDVGDDTGGDVSGDDVGQDDVSVDDGGNNNPNNANNNGLDAGLDSADEGSTPNVISGAGTNDEGCLCATPARRPGLGPWLALGFAVVGLGVARRRRRG